MWSLGTDSLAEHLQSTAFHRGLAGLIVLLEVEFTPSLADRRVAIDHRSFFGISPGLTIAPRAPRCAAIEARSPYTIDRKKNGCSISEKRPDLNDRVAAAFDS